MFGVTQGSILGPLLFLIFINDLPLYTESVVTDLYADDTTIYQISYSQNFIEQNLQAALKKLYLWCKHNAMLLNTDKTKLILIYTSQKRLRLHDYVLNLTYNSDILKNGNNGKVLGVLIDNNLSWSIYMQSIAKKISSNLLLLSELKEFSHLRIEYNFIRLIFNLTSIIALQFGEEHSNLNIIHKLQKRILKSF